MAATERERSSLESGRGHLDAAISHIEEVESFPGISDVLDLLHQASEDLYDMAHAEEEPDSIA